MTKKRIRLLVAGTAATLAVGGTAAGIAVAAGGDDAETPITGAALERASAAALAETGGGRVTDTEVGDEDAYYEVEVTLANGSEVDVHLNRDFSVTGPKAEDEEDGD